MRAGWILFTLEFKKYSKAIPALLLESVFFGVLLLSFGYFAASAVYGEKSIGEIRVGIVSKEEDKLTDMLVGFAGSMDSMEGICHIERMSEETARKALSEGIVYAAVFLPEGIVESIMNGQNLPAKVVFSDSYSRMETEVFRQLADAGVGLLQTAQAGIYAADELCVALNEEEKIKETEDYLNRAYLEYALNRQAVFKLQEVNAAGKGSLLQYYGVAVLLMFLSFAGLILGRRAKTKEDALSSILRAGGCGSVSQYLAEHFAFAGVFCLFGIPVSFPFLQLIRKAEGKQLLGGEEGIVLLLVLFTMGVCLRSLIELTGSSYGGIGILFVLLLLGMFLSGLFVPPAFLPQSLTEIGKVLPYTLFRESLLFDGIEAESMKQYAGSLLVWLAAGTGMGVMIRSIREKGNSRWCEKVWLLK